MASGGGTDCETNSPVIEARGLGFSHRGTGTRQLAGITCDIPAGSRVAVMGAAGAGKSTFAMALNGLVPHHHPGDLYGQLRVAGIATHETTPPHLVRVVGLVSQNPEAQVMERLVIDDVAAGPANLGLGRDEVLSRARRALEEVGLAGLADRETATLSGGQLQRLALAGALARSPRLLISDESTAMIDRAGRAEMLDLLASLPERGIAVVHITHDPAESARADRVITIDAGRIVSDRRVGEGALLIDEAGDPPVSPSPGASAGSQRPSAGAPALIYADHLWADRVAHTYDLGTPWEKPVLRDVSLILDPGQAMLITGDNGSGKTTLSRVLTGLLVPTWGRVTLGGRPMERCVGDVALSMQFARLQLQRPSVRSDILAAAGYGPRVGTGSAHRKGAISREAGDRIVAEAMGLVGLDPALASRGIDDLSGGQMRRVALAGLLASHPSVLILDEPMAGLDAASRDLLISVLDERRCAGLSILVISHDLEGMDSLCDTHGHLAEGVLS